MIYQDKAGLAPGVFFAPKCQMIHGIKETHIMAAAQTTAQLLQRKLETSLGHSGNAIILATRDPHNINGQFFTSYLIEALGAEWLSTICEQQPCYDVGYFFPAEKDIASQLQKKVDDGVDAPHCFLAASAAGRTGCAYQILDSAQQSRAGEAVFVEEIWRAADERGGPTLVVLDPAESHQELLDALLLTGSDVITLSIGHEDEKLSGSQVQVAYQHYMGNIEVGFVEPRFAKTMGGNLFPVDTILTLANSLQTLQRGMS